MNKQPSLHPSEKICFGLDRKTDENSLGILIERFARPELLAVLIPRLSEGEIISVLDFYTVLLRKYLSDEEYHRLFVNNR